MCSQHLRAIAHRVKSQLFSIAWRDHYCQLQPTPSAPAYHLSSSSMSPILQACGISHQQSSLTHIWNIFLSTRGAFLLFSTHWAHSCSSLNTPLKITFSLMPSIAFLLLLLIVLCLICCQKHLPQSTVRSCSHDWPPPPSIQLWAFPDHGPCLVHHRVPIG